MPATQSCQDPLDTMRNHHSSSPTSSSQSQSKDDIAQEHQTKAEESVEKANAAAAWGNEPTPNEANPQELARPWFRRAWDWLIWFIVDQWFLVGLAVVIVIASQVQVPAEHREVKQTVATYITVSLIFFITGCTLKTRILIENYMQWRQILFVQLSCFLVTSAMMFGFVSAAASNRSFMDPWLLIGFLINASVATTINSNVVMTRQAKGNSALTVVQTTIGNTLSPFISPLLIKMYLSAGAWYTDVLPANSTEFGPLYKRTMMQLGLSVLVPLFVGQVCINLFPNVCYTFWVKWKLSKIGTFALLVLIWESLDSAFGTGAFYDVRADNIIFVVFISLSAWLIWLGYSFAATVWWMNRKDVTSTLYCVPAKTAALGVPLTQTFFMGLSPVDQAKIQIPVVLFTLLQVAMGSLLTIPLRRWAVGGELQDEEKAKADAEAGHA